MRLSGVVEREAFVGGPSVDAFATVLGRFLATQDETQAAKDRRMQQACGGYACGPGPGFVALARPSGANETG
jgi:hypothetical protein